MVVFMIQSHKNEKKGADALLNTSWLYFIQVLGINLDPDPATSFWWMEMYHLVSEVGAESNKALPLEIFC